MNLIWQILSGTVDWVRISAENLHSALISLLLILLGAILLMWGINVLWLKEVNFVFFFLGAIYLIAKMSHPDVIGAAGLVGAGVQALRDEDITQGAVAGVRILYKIVLGTLLGFWILAGLLATWSFEKNPGAFLPIAAMAMLVAVLVEFFNMKGGIFKWIIMGYAVVVILAAFASTTDLPEKFEEERKKVEAEEAARASTPTMSPTTQTYGRSGQVFATWGGVAVSNPPLNVPSDWIDVTRCQTFLTKGYGYTIEYSYHGSVPQVHPGHYVDADKIRYTVYVQGKPAPSVRVECS